MFPRNVLKKNMNVKSLSACKSKLNNWFSGQFFLSLEIRNEDSFEASHHLYPKVQTCFSKAKLGETHILYV